jgi:SAM-dependent methyltransferase
MEPFYELHDIPVHSCLMFDDRATALAYPRRDLVLGFCGTCGFISNIVFDPTVQSYSAGYEEQQAFSPRFRAFQTALCTRLIEQYDLHNKDIVEIGCGKGDFLVELCEAGGNRGVGIDPACEAQRMAGRGAGRVRFLADVYSEAYADLPCDFLCCRHTLEHIHATDDFVRLMRTVVGDRNNIIVFFEVPAVERVLREAAFWDIYYEHCSYFSLGSLARVFRANRFTVVELATDYDDQYLVLVARPVDRSTTPSRSEEDDLDRLAQDVEQFRMRVGAEVGEWQQRLRLFKDEKRRVAVWGSGSKCVSFLSATGGSSEVSCVVDVNPYRQGKYLVSSGHQVVAPASLRESPPDVILVMNPIYCEEIQRDLDSMGVCAELLPV